MNCDIIQDLLPLYVDACCSEESAKLVAEHLESCENCRMIYEQMQGSCVQSSETPPKEHLRRIHDWKASVMQSVLLLLSFVIITIGVALEARTPSGLLNGFWAASLVVPATGFLLSLTNWYFVRLYKSRKSFTTGSLLTTLGITICASIWTASHYDVNLLALFSRNYGEFQEAFSGILWMCKIGLPLTVIFCTLSKILSNKYALLLGRE